MSNKIKHITFLAVLIGLNTPAQAAFGFDDISNFFSKNKIAITVAAAAVVGIGVFAYRFFKPIQQQIQRLQCPDVTWESILEIESPHRKVRDNDNVFFLPQHNFRNLHDAIRNEAANLEKNDPAIKPYCYKIHLMPANYNVDTIKSIVDILSKPENAQYIDQFKVRLHGGISIMPNGSRIPLIIIYPKSEFQKTSSFEENLFKTKENAQRLLCNLYRETNDIPGSNEQPRYNAKVTPLIWVAQGNGDDKDAADRANELSTNELYLGPEYIYANPRFDFTAGIAHHKISWQRPSEGNDDAICYLYHPETGEPLISGTYIPQLTYPVVSSE